MEFFSSASNLPITDRLKCRVSQCGLGLLVSILKQSSFINICIFSELLKFLMRNVIFLVVLHCLISPLSTRLSMPSRGSISVSYRGCTLRGMC